MTVLQKIWTTHTIRPAASPNASTAFSILIDFTKYYTLRVGPKFAPKASPNTQLLCFPNKEIQRIKAYQKATKGYKNKLNKKITQTWERCKSFLLNPIDIDTLKRMGRFLFEQHQKSVQIHTAKPWSFSFHEAFEKMHELISDHRPVPTGRTAEIPFPKVGCHLPAWTAWFNAGFAGRRRDSPAWQSLDFRWFFFWWIEKNSVVYDLKNKNTSGTLSYPRAIIFK